MSLMVGAALSFTLGHGILGDVSWACPMGLALLLFSYFMSRTCPVQSAGPWRIKDMWGRSRPNSMGGAMATEPTLDQPTSANPQTHEQAQMIIGLGH